MTTGTEDYYRARAAEYDRVYEKPERAADLARLRAWVPEQLAGRAVLEVAAGTGYWTDVYVDSARSLLATDANIATLEVAERRRSWPATARFEAADAFQLGAIAGSFDAAFVGFFWSHVRLDELDRFVAGLAARLQPGATVVLIDNLYVEHSSSPITRTDAGGNTYQERRLADKSSWEVLKNFPTGGELLEHLEPAFTSVRLERLTYYWTAACQLEPTTSRAR